MIEHHSNVVRHTARLQQGDIMHTAHDTGVLMYGVGLDYVQSLLHGRKRDGDVLRLKARTGRQLQRGRHSAVQTPVDVLLACCPLDRKGDIHVVPVAAICHAVTHVVGGLHRHGHHRHTGRGGLGQFLAFINRTRLHLYRVSGRVCQIAGNIERIGLPGPHAYELRILKIRKDGCATFHDETGAQIRISADLASSRRTDAHGISHHETGTQRQILGSGQGGTRGIGQVYIHHHLVIVRVLGKAYLPVAFPAFTILLRDCHHVLRAVLAVRHVDIRHGAHQRGEHRAARWGFRLTGGQLLRRGGLVINTFDIVLHQPAAHRKITRGLVTGPIGLLHVQTVLVIYFLCHIVIL